MPPPRSRFLSAMDPDVRKKTLRLLSNGVYIMTSRHKERYGAATVTWVSQASFKPPLIMAAVRPTSNVFQCLTASGHAALHIVADDQKDMAQKFFSPTAVDGNAINGEPFSEGIAAAPLLENAHAHIECRVIQILDGIGDHAVVILEVIEAQYASPLHPLTIAESPWNYGG